jgi:hypothetical protein
MSVGQVSWTGQGIFFSDEDNDVLLTKGSSPLVVPNKKTDYQDGLVVIQNGARVGVFNGGIVGDGYREEVVIFEGVGLNCP